MAPRSIHGLANSRVSGKGAKARAVTASTAPRLSGSMASTRTGVNRRRGPGGAGGFAQERAFPPVALDAMDKGAGNIRELDGDHEAREAGAGPHVDPAFGLRREREELGQIRDMAGPRRRGRSNWRCGWSCAATDPAVRRNGKPVLCFT